VSATSASQVASTSIAVPVPAGATTGRLMLASITIRGSATIATPTGWTLIRSDVNGSTMRVSTYRRFAATNEPASYVFTFSKSTTASTAGMAVYAGVDPTNPINAHAGQVNTRNTTQVVAPALTTTIAGTLLTSIFGSASLVTATPPSGMTERYDISSNGSSKVAEESADQQLGAAGSTGTRTATISKATSSIGQSIALRPAP
jgi:hypothetical protein